MPAKTRKMTNIKVMETSGVDHPAHLHEGFAVMKSANPTNARAIMEALGKDRKMPVTKTTATSAAPKMVTLSEADLQATVKKAVDAQLQTILDEQAKAWQDLNTYAQQQDDSTPSTSDAGAGAAPAAAPAAAAATTADPNALLKSLGSQVPEAVRKAFEKQAADIAKAREDFEKERDLRLDNEAVASFKKSYANLAIDADKTAPALRRLEASQPEVFKSLTETLTALNAQQDGALSPSLLKELGTVAVTKTASYADVDTQAQALVDAGKFNTIQKARAHIFETNPQAVNTVREEA